MRVLPRTDFLINYSSRKKIRYKKKNKGWPDFLCVVEGGFRALHARLDELVRAPADPELAETLFGS